MRHTCNISTGIPYGRRSIGCQRRNTFSVEIDIRQIVCVCVCGLVSVKVGSFVKLRVLCEVLRGSITECNLASRVTVICRFNIPVVFLCK